MTATAYAERVVRLEDPQAIIDIISLYVDPREGRER
jgi:hypothetical protein